MNSFGDEFDDMYIQEEEEILEYVHSDRKPYTIRHRICHMDSWDDAEFFRRFRLTKVTVTYLLSLIDDKLQYPTERNHAISPIIQLLMALRFYATCNFYTSVGDFTGVHKTTAAKIIKRVSTAIAKLKPQFINLPRKNNEIKKLQQEFYDIAKFPMAVAALDCTHVRIQSPGGKDAEVYRNQKGYFSISVQAMCDAKLLFLDIVVHWPGSTHNSFIFQNSEVRHKFDNQYMGNGLILANSAYTLSEYLITPLNNPQTVVEKLFNKSQIRSRNVIERCFGLWKRRFPVLSIGMRCRIPLTQDIIVATAVLHNMAIMSNEIEPPNDPELPPIPYEPVIYQENFNCEEEITGNDSTKLVILDFFESLINQSDKNKINKLEQYLTKWI